MQKEFLTKEELGRRLSIKPETIARLTQQGKIPAVKVSYKIIRYDYEAVLSAIKGTTDGN